MSILIEVLEHEDETLLWLHKDGQTLGTESLATSEAWQFEADSFGQEQRFQTLRLVSAAQRLVDEVFPAGAELEWLGKCWRVTIGGYAYNVL